MRITHLGHSCVLVESGGTRLLLDPGNFTADLDAARDLDAVLVTHQHPDHLDVERLPGLLASNANARLYVEREAMAVADGAGLTATPLNAGDTLTLGGVRVEAVGGEHALIHPDILRVGNVGLVLRPDDGPTLFHPGDSYGVTPGDVDVLLLPLTAPWTSIRETVAFARAVAAPRTVPIHDGGASALGRAVYLRLVSSLVEETSVRDLAGAGPVSW